jgi:hypothetical protein
MAANLGCPRPDTQAPGNVTNFTATPGDTEVALTWINATDSDYQGVKIKRKEGGYPTGPDDGTTVYEGGDEQTTDTGLTNGTLYYYTAFSFDKKPNYSSGAQAQATPTGSSGNAQILEEFNSAGTQLGALQIPPSARQTLEDKLQAAEDDYRNGDPCGAATNLHDFEDSAQNFRTSSTDDNEIGAFEEAYVLGRRLRYDLILANDSKTPCSGEERVGEESAATVDDQHNSNTELQSTVNFGEPKLVTVHQNGQVFTQVFIPGSDNLTGEPGAPAVPVFRRLVAVPEGAQVECESTATPAETIHLNVLPTQMPAVDDDPGPAPDPSVFADKPFTQNTQLYQSDTPYPVDVCKLTDLGRLRDLRVFQLEIPAGQYNAFADSLTLFRDVHVDVTFTGGTGKFIPAVGLSAFESDPQSYFGSVLNRDIVRDYADIAHIFDFLGEEFMILTPTSLRAAADTLATWKNKKGIVTRVFEVGAGTAYTTADSMVQLIRSEYETSSIRPSYVLLLGDTSFIPTYYITPNGDVGADTIATDYPYAAFQLLGILPRVALGRIPVSNLADANFVVNRIVAYESDPPINTDFYKHATIASQFQCCRTDAGTNPGTDQRSFAETAEFARNALVGAGYTVDRIYTETTDAAYTGNTTPQRWYDGTAIPAGLTWGGTGADITTAWNAGRFLMIHRDHGWPGGWANPGFDWAAASALTNGTLLPVVFSVNCASGLFDQATAGGAMSTMAGVQYFADRLLTNANGGAIGLLGDSRNSPSWSNSALLRGFVDAVWPNALTDFGDGTSHRRLGDILNHGKIYLFTQGGVATNVTWNDVGDEFKMWHCLGDPTLEIWTKNPNRFLSTLAEARITGTSLTATFATEGATLTAFHRDGNLNLVALGRGTVENGVATFELVNTPVPGEQLTLAATLPGTVSEQILTNVTDTVPPGAVTNFQATVGNLIQVSLSWTNPNDPDFNGVRIQRRGDAFPTSPTDGTTVYDGTGNNALDNDVSNNSTYYYTAFAHDTSGNFSGGASDDATILIIH